MSECRVCLGPCRRDIHDATLRVRKWFRDQVLPAPFVAFQPAKTKRKPNSFELVTKREKQFYEPEKV